MNGKSPFNAFFVLVILLGLCAPQKTSATPVTFNTLDPRFHGTVGESRQIGAALISVGYWQEGGGPQQAAMASTANGVTTYTILNVPAFNGVTSSTSQARGISADGTIAISATFPGQGARVVTVNASSPSVGNVVSGGGGLGYSAGANGITSAGTIYGSNFQYILPTGSNYSALLTGNLGGGEIFDGRTTNSGELLVGNGSDGVDMSLVAFLDATILSLYNCGQDYCAPGRLDFNGNPISSVTVGNRIGYWNILTNQVVLLDLGAGAQDRGLWFGGGRNLLFYTQNNSLNIFDTTSGTSALWNVYCGANPDFCAAVATMAKDIGKGNSSGQNWYADISGTSYQTVNSGVVSETPEPASWACVVLGGLVLFALRKRHVGLHPSWSRQAR